MFGGYYVTLLRDGCKPALIAGPFELWDQADKIGPTARDMVIKTHPRINQAPDDEWGIAEFYFHRRVDGQFNAALWVKPYEGRK